MAVRVDWEEVYILTGKLAYANMMRVLNGPPAKAPALLDVTKPIFSVQFPNGVLRGVGVYKFRGRSAVCDGHRPQAIGAPTCYPASRSRGQKILRRGDPVRFCKVATPPGAFPRKRRPRLTGMAPDTEQPGGV